MSTDEQLERLEQRLTALTEEHRHLCQTVSWLLSHQHVGIQSSKPVHINYADGSDVLVVEPGETTQPLEGEP